MGSTPLVQEDLVCQGSCLQVRLAPGACALKQKEPVWREAQLESSPSSTERGRHTAAKTQHSQKNRPGQVQKRQGTTASVCAVCWMDLVHLIFAFSLYPPQVLLSLKRISQLQNFPEVTSQASRDWVGLGAKH